MTAGGKPGNPKTGFPLFPPSLEIAKAISTFPPARRFPLIIKPERKTLLRKVLPMSSDRSVTYVPGRTFGRWGFIEIGRAAAARSAARRSFHGDSDARNAIQVHHRDEAGVVSVFPGDMFFRENLERFLEAGNLSRGLHQR